MRGGGVRAALLIFIFGVRRTNELALERRSASNIADQWVRPIARARREVCDLIEDLGELFKCAAQPTARGTLATLNRPIRRRIPQAFDIGH